VNVNLEQYFKARALIRHKYVCQLDEETHMLLICCQASPACIGS